jgi:acetaldehyde dehydrogenase (acetylating)
MRTVGVLRELHEERVLEIGVPLGVIAAILPTTNPTSTAIYKTLIALKAGNAIVISPHPRARRSTCETAAVLAQAAEAAGAPAGLVQCIGEATLESTSELMRHRQTAAILSTGGAGIVRAAYASGKPAFGVGPGNVPVLVDTSADLKEAVAGILRGKTFDYGTLCSSEQTLVAERSLREAILAELAAQGAYLCNAGQKAALERLLIGPGFSINPDCVGQPAAELARRAGFAVPASARVLAVEIAAAGKSEPLSAEKLSPVLSLLFVEDFARALDACEAILRFGGLGHTCGIYTEDEARAREYGLRMPAFRVLVNTPTPLGSTGITTNLFPAMTLGCGAMAGNSTGDNVSPLHLINIKRVAWGVRSGAAATPPATAPERAEVIAAVERYLARRGVTVVGGETAAVVDRFLAARRAAAPGGAESTPAPAAAAPAPATVDFVCEDDVRRAIREGRRIHLAARAIITPSARDLAARHDVLVLPSGHQTA